MLDKIMLNGEGCNKIYEIIQQTSENVINRIRVKCENILNVDVSLDDTVSS